MAGSTLATSLLVAGLLVLGCCQQQYEEEPSRVWQPSRLPRTQSSSLFGNANSSPQVPRRQRGQEKIQVHNVSKNLVPEVQIERRSHLDQPRFQHQVSRNKGSIRRNPQTFSESDENVPETELRRSSFEKISSREFGVSSEARKNFPSRKSEESGETTLMLSLVGARPSPPSQKSLEENPTLFEDEKIRKNQQIESSLKSSSLEAKTAPPLSPRTRSNFQSSRHNTEVTPVLSVRRMDEPRAPRPVVPRRTSSRVNTRTSQPTTVENEAVKAPRSRGRLSTLSTTTTLEPILIETESTERAFFEKTKQTAFDAPAETSPSSNLPINEKGQTLRNSSKRKQYPNLRSQSGSSEEDSRSSERGQLKRFPSRVNVQPSEPEVGQKSSMSSKEGLTARFASREETISPGEQNNIQTTLTTEGYTEPVVNQNNKQRVTSRGRVRATTEHSAPLLSPNAGKVPISRGEKKAQLEITLKENNEDISDEDNYPREFIEKIKNSVEKSNDTKPITSKSPGIYRFGRTRNLSPQVPRTRQRQESMDSDVSESIHEDTIEQEIPAAGKPKEISTFTMKRFQGKVKSPTTTTTETPTTKSPTRLNQTSNVDALRQRYRNKLKQSQEERQQKLAGLRPKLLKDNIKSIQEKESPSSDISEMPSEEKSTPKSFARESSTSFKPLSKFPRPSKNRYEPKMQTSIAGETHRFRSRFSMTQPDSAVEPATPTVAEYSRTKNRYSRLRKEEFIVETPESKTSWIKDLSKPKREESAYNFIRLRTKDLTPLASEDVIEMVANNEVLDISTTTLKTEASNEEGTTIRNDNAVTDAPITTSMRLETEVTTMDKTMAPSVAMTTEAALRETTVQDEVTNNLIVSSTPDENAVSSQQGSASTRHRFSSKYNGSTMPSENTTELPSVQDETSSSTLFPLNLFASSLSPEISTLSSTPPSTNSMSTTVSSAITASTSANSVSTTVPSATTVSTSANSVSTTVPSATTVSTSANSVSTTVPSATTVSTSANSVSTTVPSATTVSTSTTTVISTTTKRAPTTKKKNKLSKTTTTSKPGFLDNRPILRNIVSLFGPSTTTTKKPTTSKPKQKKPKPKITSTSTTTAPTIQTTASTTEGLFVGNNTIDPLPLAISAEEIINSTQEVINNRTSIGSAFSKVPREQLDALTPLPFINTTEPTTNNEADENLESRMGLSASSSTTEEMQNVTSQPVFFDYSSSTPREPQKTTITTTTPSTTTAGDYFVYGIYPNNTVIKKRAWKTFDYEKYMSPYVIFGIYPNNTIVRKFPNGTIINDEFMTSDNEIGDPSPSSTSTTSTTRSPDISSSLSTTSLMTNTEISNLSSTTTILTSPEASSSSATTTEIAQLSMELTTQSIVNEDEVTINNGDEYITENFASLSTFSEGLPEISMTTNPIPQTTEGTTLDVGSLLLGSTTQSTTPITSTGNNLEETTVDPAVNPVLPLTIEEVQSLWTGNFSDSVGGKTSDNAVSSSIMSEKSANLISTTPLKGFQSLTNIAFRALSTSGTTTTIQSTTDEVTMSPESTTRKPRVKFVTLTPGVLVTTDLQDDDAITLSSQHVQKVTKAPKQIPDDLLTNVFGNLELKASSPIPDILKEVNEVEGDGLTAALARRIIALAMERAKSTTESVATTTMLSTKTEFPVTTEAATTLKTTKAPKRKQSTRTTSKGPSLDASQQQIISIPVGTDLQDVLAKLLQAQNLETATQIAQLSTTIKAPAEMEKAVENQIRLAEQVRKASRTMKKKKKKARTTTTQAPPFNLGFLFNFFNRPSPPPVKTSVRTSKKVKTSTPSVQPTNQLLLLTSVPSAQTGDPDVTPETGDSNDAQGERQTRGQLLTAAIDVTKAVSKFMGTVINNAAQSFQSFVRGSWGR